MVNKLPEDWLETLKTEYPRRSGGQGWVKVKELIPRAIKNGASWDEILFGTRAYKAWCDNAGKTGTELVKQAQTFFGKGEWWGEDYSLPNTAKVERYKAGVWPPPGENDALQ